MLGTIARVALLRIVPRRLIPLLTAWQVIRMLRGRGSQNAGRTTPADNRPPGSRRR